MAQVPQQPKWKRDQHQAAHVNSTEFQDAAPSVNISTITVADVVSGRSFLVDTGAEESVFPANVTDRKKARGPSLVAANGSAIPTYGKRNIPLQVGQGASFIQKFWIADVTQPILGADFFATQRLAIDLTNRRLVSLDGGLVIPGRPVRSQAGRGIHKIHSRYEAILEKFPELLVPVFTENKHGILHYIPTTGSPVHARARRLDHEKLTAAKAEFDEMEHLGKPKKFTWTPECQAAFQEAKSALASAVMLHHPDPQSETKLSVDASDTAMGAELSQQQNGVWKPIVFLSRKLTPTQQRYSTFDHEMLAIYSAIQHFRYFLEGRIFTVFTDHKPLTHALTSNTDKSPRQERQLCYIDEFTTDIRHISGSDNMVPDTLSRAPVPDQEPLIASASPVPALDLAQMAAAQQTDPNVVDLRSKPGSLQLKDVTLDGTQILCDVSTGRPRPVVPPTWTKTVFDVLHNLCHPGPKPTTRAISARYIWPGLKKDVKNMVRVCHECQVSKIGHHTKAPLSPFDPPDRRFGDIHVDLVGPLLIRRLPLSVYHCGQIHKMARSYSYPQCSSCYLCQGLIAYLDSAIRGPRHNYFRPRLSVHQCAVAGAEHGAGS
ncbi:hypothetical protein ACOMHN_008333 [Nucella lapillus]